MSEVLKLNLGCGRTIIPGWINVDYRPGPGVDVVADLENPLPWSDNTVDEVLASHVLEHLVRWEYTVEEVHRILKPGGRFTIHVPYGPDHFTGHIRTFTSCTLDGFIEGLAFNERGLDSIPLYRQISRSYRRSFPYRWAINRYTGLKIPQYGRIGWRKEISWELEKVIA